MIDKQAPALVLTDGGALAAYQVGALQALAEIIHYCLFDSLWL